MNKPKLFIMIGAPGSGKDTWIAGHKQLFPQVKVVSRDEIRLSLLEPGDSFFSKERKVFSTFVKEIKEGLKAGQDVIANATHLNAPSRAKLLSSLGSLIYDIQVYGIVFYTDLPTCLKQNAMRTGLALVPENDLRTMFNRLEIPTLREGFTCIWIRTRQNNAVSYEIIE